MTIRIAPSVLSADLGRLREQLDQAIEGGADWIHVDVMDGRFVPNISIGVPVVASLRKVATRPLDVHLMIVEPERYLEAFAEAGASSITVHAEATPHLQRCVARIRELGLRPGVAINPATPVAALEEIVADVGLVLVMSVNPGFGGQRYLPGSTSKIRRVRELLARHDAEVLIEVDGGIGPDNIAEVVAAGADVVVAGSSVFGSTDVEGAMAGLQAGAATGLARRERAGA